MKNITELPSSIRRAKSALESFIRDRDRVRQALAAAQRDLAEASNTFEVARAALADSESEATLTSSAANSATRKAFMNAREAITIVQARVDGLSGKLKIAGDKIPPAIAALRAEYLGWTQELNRQIEAEYNDALDKFMGVCDLRESVALATGDGRVVVKLRKIVLPDDRIASRYSERSNRTGWKNPESLALHEQIIQIRQEIAGDCGDARDTAEPQAMKMIVAPEPVEVQV